MSLPATPDALLDELRELDQVIAAATEARDAGYKRRLELWLHGRSFFEPPVTSTAMAQASGVSEPMVTRTVNKAKEAAAS